MDMEDFLGADDNSPDISEESPDEEDYDAINDETFGGELHDLDGTLEEFANRTAGLLLDEPCSSSAAPVPKMLWVDLDPSKSSTYFPGAKTLEEIEREQLRSGAVGSPSRVFPQCSVEPIKQSFPPPSKAPWHKVDVSSRLGFDSNAPLDFSLPPPQILPFTQPPVFSSRVPYGLPSMPSSLPSGGRVSPPRVPGGWMADRNISSPANGIYHPYPIHPQPPQRNHRGHHQPSPMHHQPYNNNNNRHPPYYGSPYNNGNDGVLPPHQQHRGSTTSLANTNSCMTSMTNGRMGRPRGLPSTKTIADFALDPYAGFMSKKEREWLIKIHLIQCTSTGDATEDDFYYTVWKKRNVLRKHPQKSKLRPRYYSFQDTYPSAAYVPPLFSGSLGKPTHCSAKVPRQLIDCSLETVEEDGGKNTQKKLKAILMRIENANLLLMQCDTLKRELTCSLDEERSLEMSQKIKEYMAVLTAMVYDVTVLSTLMMIQKGRTFVFQLMNFCDLDDMYGILKKVIEALPKYAKKIPDNAVLEFGKHIYSLLLILSEERVIELTRLLDAVLFASTKLMLAIAIIFCTVLAKMDIGAGSLSDSGLVQWLYSPAAGKGSGANDGRPDGLYALVMTSNVEEMFSGEDLPMLRCWLIASAKPEAQGGGSDVRSTLLCCIAKLSDETPEPTETAA